MLVILTDEQILSPQKVCQSCLLADQSGLPRWRQGKLGCGHILRLGGALAKLKTDLCSNTEGEPELYECQMGFRIANIE